jgi:hypothetical protein
MKKRGRPEDRQQASASTGGEIFPGYLELFFLFWK